MSNVSIYEKNWTDLVFENRNKAYGAYQLRNESGRTTLLAFLVGLLFIFSIYGSWRLLASFGDKPDIEIGEIPLDPTITPVIYDPVQPRLEPVAPATPYAQNQLPQEPTNLSNMVVTRTQDAQDDVPINEDLTNQPVDNGDKGSENGTAPATPSGTVSGTDAPAAIDPSIVRKTVELDRLPEYPGGMKKFYEYVGNSIEKSKFDDNAGSVSVIMGFVIERDGTMSDIKVLRGSDKNLEKEAIRVLKSLRIKWAPGVLDGEKVRTQYTLPIKVDI